MNQWSVWLTLFVRSVRRSWILFWCAIANFSKQKKISHSTYKYCRIIYQNHPAAMLLRGNGKQFLLQKRFKLSHCRKGQEIKNSLWFNPNESKLSKQNLLLFWHQEATSTTGIKKMNQHLLFGNRFMLLWDYESVGVYGRLWECETHDPFNSTTSIQWMTQGIRQREIGFHNPAFFILQC